ncbi:uncharacterized protein LTR77_004935 [Saxophila tyrrhenica]|uniref:Uncharacterized protein n=1 Tax=Saxophila tyrrhenica TaxID=1690608 RepID=A0AAV9PEV2_9PEZI|nr:hypothetical protein LTR77_004935 [Saxophila tyrrhenica]
MDGPDKILLQSATEISAPAPAPAPARAPKPSANPLVPFRNQPAKKSQSNAKASPAKLRKDADDARKTTEADYDRLAEKDALIEQLRATIAKGKEYNHKVTTQVVDLTRERDAMVQKVQEAERDLPYLKGIKEQYHKDKLEFTQAKQARRDRALEVTAASDELKVANKHITELKSQVEASKKQTADYTELVAAKSTIQGEKEKVSEQLQQAQETIEELQKERDGFQQENEASQAMRDAQAEFQEISNEGSALTLPEILDRVRSDHAYRIENPLMRRRPVLDRPSNRRLVSGASLQDELDDLGHDSSIEEDDDEKPDETVKHPASSMRPILRPISIMDRVKRPTSTKRPAASKPPTPAPLGFSKIVSVSTSPVKPAPAAVIAPPEVQIVREVSTITRTPAWLQPLLLLGLVLYALVLAAVIGERRLWTGANDLARQRVGGFVLGEVSNWHPLVSLFSGLDGVFGHEYGLLG